MTAQQGPSCQHCGGETVPVADMSQPPVRHRVRNLSCPVSAAEPPGPANDNEGPFSLGQVDWAGLAKLSEECAEVCQVIAKLVATGGEVNHWSGDNLARRLEEEMGDVQAALNFVQQHNRMPRPGRHWVSESAISIRARSKLALFNEWHGKIPQVCSEDEL